MNAAITDSAMQQTARKNLDIDYTTAAGKLNKGLMYWTGSGLGWLESYLKYNYVDKSAEPTTLPYETASLIMKATQKDFLGKSNHGETPVSTDKTMMFPEYNEHLIFKSGSSLFYIGTDLWVRDPATDLPGKLGDIDHRAVDNPNWVKYSGYYQSGFRKVMRDRLRDGYQNMTIGTDLARGELALAVGGQTVNAWYHLNTNKGDTSYVTVAKDTVNYLPDSDGTLATSWFVPDLVSAVFDHSTMFSGMQKVANLMSYNESNQSRSSWGVTMSASLAHSVPNIGDMIFRVNVDNTITGVPSATNSIQFYLPNLRPGLELKCSYTVTRSYIWADNTIISPPNEYDPILKNDLAGTYQVVYDTISGFRNTLDGTAGKDILNIYDGNWHGKIRGYSGTMVIQSGNDTWNVSFNYKRYMTTNASAPYHHVLITASEYKNAST